MAKQLTKSKLFLHETTINYLNKNNVTSDGISLVQFLPENRTLQKNICLN
jgi:hypothetical protein